MALGKTLRFIWEHPITSQDRLRATWDYVRWQVGSRLLPGPAVVPFVAETCLVVERGMTGATGNVYAGLHELESMAFVLHFLRPEDRFADVGANVGSYTVLASGAAGAHTVAFEPVPLSFRRLERNVAVNRLDALVDARQQGIGRGPGRIRFTTDRDTANRAVPFQDSASDATVEVPVTSLDDALGDAGAALLKIDVEGMEVEVLEGAHQLLDDPRLEAIALELTEGRGYEPAVVLDSVMDRGFTRIHYAPLTREIRLAPPGAALAGNVLLVRSVDGARERLATAPRYRVRTINL